MIKTPQNTSAGKEKEKKNENKKDKENKIIIISNQKARSE